MEHTSQPSWKRTFKCGISLLVFVFDETRKTLARALGRAPKRKCVVLYYHSVPASQRKMFAEQLDVVLRHTRVVRTDLRTEQGADPIGESDSARNCTAITFDDGFENFLTQALPELEQRNIPTTVFIIADGMNREFGSDAYAEKLLSLEQVRSLPTSLVTIGSHTSTHPLLTQVDEGEARREIQESRAKLEGMLGREVKEFSFPFGGFNEPLVDFCHAAGYERVYTTLPAFAFERQGELLIGRIRVDPTDWGLEFRLKLAGAYRWLPMIFSWKRRIVAIAHRSLARPAVRPATPRSVVR